MLSLLAVLLELLWAVTAALALSAPTSENDLFRAIATHASPKPEPLLCFLQPLPPPDSFQDDVLLSFEEWKKRQIREKVREADSINHSMQATGSSSRDNANGSDNGNGSVILSLNITRAEDASDVEHSLGLQPTEITSPHFRVPLTDRFNYASLDCSAQVHMAHRSAKSPSSILSSKRDRYMLSPCDSKEQHFVIVELCEDIMIDTVQLANFEFFSGVFKDFRVSVSKTEMESWTSAGTYRAKNVRGVQSFHLPRSQRDFYRYIRIDFLSHYGNEFYCPVSLLRVYGLTHLEQWKWDIWEAESRAKILTEIPSSPPASIDSVTATRLGLENSKEGGSGDPNVPPTTPGQGANMSTLVVESASHPRDISVPGSNQSGSTAHSTAGAPTVVEPTDAATTGFLSDADTETTDTLALGAGGTISTPLVAPTLSATTQKTHIITPPGSVTIDHALVLPLSEAVDSPTSHITLAGTPSQSSIAAATGMNATPLHSTVPMAAISPRIPPVTTGGESIYRTIMNRLTALEANHTLYTQYVEQQNGGLREVLRRLQEDVGRLEGISRGQAQGYQRTLREWEKRQQQQYMEYKELKMRVEYLSDEIVLEKRLSIAQLCLLLTVLVFMGLTRGSRGEHVRFQNSMRKWSRRHLSFHGDWTNRFRSGGGSPSINSKEAIPQPPPPHSARSKPMSLPESDIKLEFPRKLYPTPLKLSEINTGHAQLEKRNETLAFQPLFTQPRPPTPFLRTRQHYQHHQKLMTPTSSGHRPGPYRSNSQGSGGIVHTQSLGSGTGHRSAKKWGRVAHLHEVRRLRRDEAGQEKENGDSFSGPDRLVSRRLYRRGDSSEDIFGSVPKGRDVRRDSSISPTKGSRGGEGEGDQWVDTDLEESEGGEWEIQLDTGQSTRFGGNANEH